MIGLDYTGTVNCGFCGQQGHNITSCSQVAVIAEDAELKQAKGYPITYKHKQALHEMRKRKQRKAKANKPRSKAKCSFCRSENHRRPSCQQLKTFRSEMYAANKNWKKKFVETANKVEIGVGALVKIPMQFLDWTADKDDWLTCMVVSYDLDTLNVFSCYDGKGDFRTTARMKMVTMEANQEFYWPFNRVLAFVNLGIAVNRWHYNTDSTKVISGCPWEPPEGWLAEKNPEIEFVLKKTSVENITVMKRIDKLLEQWGDKNE